jgi:bloom syndrome protein
LRLTAWPSGLAGRGAGVCVVISPLRALMKDQVDHACVPTMALVSDTPEGDKQRLYAQLDGHAPLTLKCLLVSPEMLDRTQRLYNALARLAKQGLLSLVAVDEAHCVVDWGTTFRKDYANLKAMIDGWEPRPPVMALTASPGNASGREAIARALGLRQPRLVMTSLNRPNIRYEVRYPDSFSDTQKTSEAQDDDLIALLREPDALGGPLRCGVVFCRSVKECNRVAELLCGAGFKAAAYYKDKGDAERKRVQTRWTSGDLAIVVATVAFGMGATARSSAFQALR